MPPGIRAGHLASAGISVQQWDQPHHNHIAIAERTVMVFVKDFHWD